MDDSLVCPPLARWTGPVGRVSAMISVLMVAAVFPRVIGNSVRLEHLRPPRYH